MELFANDIKIPFGETISLKFYNPLFNDIGASSFPLSFPSKLAVVNKAFGFPVKQEASDPGYISARIRNHIIDLIGSWEANETQGGSVNAYFKGSSGDFYSMIKDKFLTDLEFGGIKYPAGVGADYMTILNYMTTKMNASYPTDEWTAFMAYMSNPVEGVSGDMEVNPVYHDNPSGVPSFTTSFKLNSTVYLFAGTVIDYIFSEFGYKIEKNIFREDVDLQRLVIFNTFNRVKPFTLLTIDDAFDYTKLVPRVSISDFLKAIRNKFNIGFFINEQSRSVKILSFDSIIQAGPAAGKFKTGSLKIDRKRGTGLSFTASQPDDWSNCPFDSLSKLDPDGSVITVNKLSDIVPATMTGHPIFVKAEANYYTVNEDLEITKQCPDMFPYSEGSAAEPIEQLCGSPALFTLVKTFLPSTTINYIVPRCDLQTNRAGFPYTDFPLMFVFARGIQDCYVEDGFERQYPCGTTDVYDAKGNAISGATLAMRWDKEYGIIERFWEERIAWELFIKKLIKTDFFEADLNKLIDFSIIKRAGNSNYILNALTVELSNKITRITEAELFRL
jgi:hypothetical protein